MKKKSVVIATVISACACLTTITKAEAFELTPFTSYTPNPNGLTFIVNFNPSGPYDGYAVKSIKNLKLFSDQNETYNISFATGSTKELGRLKILNYNNDRALEAHLSIAEALRSLTLPDGLRVNALEDLAGNKQYEWSILGNWFWWTGFWSAEYGYSGVLLEGPFGGSTLLYSRKTYTIFSPQVPEPITFIGSLTALGFGIAIKKKFVSTQK
ncbi:PEP-CTERM sorting domain-containing protein [Nostoc spongiaeforme FACHB-130]|uniref:PEP-CTERM sorting domain-containing protein n=1 Tax=Nostoc spongiaeforme FACHB-130 TaxID=1357510 RepID=A0ABR8G3E5_9NOSO|nr:PEP-CTERM sorting domain-containing protein [Nostoc spongiaeforme]MBD2597751.1 PEP-CTERM sorting domain-containing protein [Nostoc spongiaeforme FACHB-130]